MKPQNVYRITYPGTDYPIFQVTAPGQAEAAGVALQRLQMRGYPIPGSLTTTCELLGSVTISVHGTKTFTPAIAAAAQPPAVAPPVPEATLVGPDQVPSFGYRPAELAGPASENDTTDIHRKRGGKNKTQD